MGGVWLENQYVWLDGCDCRLERMMKGAKEKWRRGNSFVVLGLRMETGGWRRIGMKSLDCRGKQIEKVQINSSC